MTSSFFESVVEKDQNYLFFKYPPLPHMIQLNIITVTLSLVEPIFGVITTNYTNGKINYVSFKLTANAKRSVADKRQVTV